MNDNSSTQGFEKINKTLSLLNQKMDLVAKQLNNIACSLDELTKLEKKKLDLEVAKTKIEHRYLVWEEDDVHNS